MKIRLKPCALCGSELTTDSEPVLPTTVQCSSCGAHNVLDDHKSPWPSSKGTDDDTMRLNASEVLEAELQHDAERMDEDLAIGPLGVWG